MYSGYELVQVPNCRVSDASGLRFAFVRAVVADQTVLDLGTHAMAA